MALRSLPTVASPVLGAAVGVILWAGACAAATQPPAVERTPCGAYEIVPSGKDASGQPSRLSIQKNGRLLLTVSDRIITRVACADTDADGLIELLVTSSSGGAQCCETLHVWALDSKPHRLLEYSAGHAAGFDLRDLAGDGRKELIVGDDTFAYFGDLCDTCSPSRLPMILCRRDRGFEDCTRRFPDVLKEALAGFTAELRPPATETDRQTVEGAALGALAIWVLLGEEDKGIESIRALVASDDVMKWLERARPQVRDWAAARGKRIRD
jgi:hypothetical protein